MAWNISAYSSRFFTFVHTGKFRGNRRRKPDSGTAVSARRRPKRLKIPCAVYGLRKRDRPTELRAASGPAIPSDAGTAYTHIRRLASDLIILIGARAAKRSDRRKAGW